MKNDTRVAEVAKYSTGLVERDSHLVAVARKYSQWVAGGMFGIVSEYATVMGASGLPDGQLTFASAS